MSLLVAAVTEVKSPSNSGDVVMRDVFFKSHSTFTGGRDFPFHVSCDGIGLVSRTLAGYTWELLLKASLS